MARISNIDFQHAENTQMGKQTVESKYKDESITLGQALVAHHYFQQFEPTNLNFNQQRLSQDYQQNITTDQDLEFAQLPAQAAVNQLGYANQQRGVVQFDLAQTLSSGQLRSLSYGKRKNQKNVCSDVKEAYLLNSQLSEIQQQQETFGRRKPLEICAKGIKDALTWPNQSNQDSPDVGLRGKKKTFDQVTQIQMERSPQKWKTSYRDQYRQFTSSPNRMQNVEDQMDGYQMEGDDYRPILQQMEGDAEAVYQQYEKEPPQVKTVQTSKKSDPTVIVNDAQSANKNSDLKGVRSFHKESEAGDRTDNPVGRRVHIFQTEEDSKPQKKKVRPLTAQEKALKRKAAEINSTTRWFADSAFTTYFGKPAFHAYGKGNVNPTNELAKMLTHNINAATGKQKTQYQQVYDHALVAGLEKTQGVRVPTLPIQKEKFLQEKQMAGNPIMPKTLDEQKKETLKILKNGMKQVSIKITKPRLTIDGFKVEKEDVDNMRKSRTQSHHSESTHKRRSVSRSSKGGPRVQQPSQQEQSTHSRSGKGRELRSDLEDLKQIESADHSLDDVDELNSEKNKMGSELEYKHECLLTHHHHTNQRNPKHMSNMPACFINTIIPAGKSTVKSNGYNLLTGI